MECFASASSFKELKMKVDERANEIWNNDWYNRDDFFDKIHIKHSDGSVFKICYCFYRGGWVNDIKVFIVFSEHNGNFVFAKEDLLRFKTKKGKEKNVVFKLNEDEEG